jgi:hypothetical protein
MKTSWAWKNRFAPARVPSNAKFRAARHGRVACWVASFAPLLFIGSAFGQPLNIAVSSAQYSTWVYSVDIDTNNQPLPPVSRTTISSSPISDGIDTPSPFRPPPFNTIHADASAGLFEVSVNTVQIVGNAQAQATNQLWFSPVVDQVQTVGIQILAGPNVLYTYGSISLLDLTSNSELWNYYWMELSYANNIPGGGPGANGANGKANFNVDTDFLASHQYLLTMTVGSNANKDGESADIQLAGLQVIPEPSSVCLLPVALLALSHFRKMPRRPI